MGFVLSILLLVPEPSFVPIPLFVPVPKFATKTIEVVKTPGRMVRECINGVCRERWVPALMERIEVKGDIDPIDRRALVRYHWSLSLGSCGMAGCVSHGGGWELTDDAGNPAPPGTEPASDDAERPSASPGQASSGQGQGWYLGKNLRKLRR